MKNLLMFGCFCLLYGLGPAQPVPLRAFSEASLDSLRAVEAYQYGQDPLPESPSEASPATPEGRENNWLDLPISAILLYSLLAVVLVIVMVIMLRQVGANSGRRVEARADQPAEVKDLITTDFSTLVAESEARQDWRMALRYHYLWILQQLQARNFIQWHPYKTDSDYEQELAGRPMGEAFSELMRTFVYTWYRGSPLTQEVYQVQQARAQQFHQQYFR